MLKSIAAVIAVIAVCGGLGGVESGNTYGWLWIIGGTLVLLGIKIAPVCVNGTGKGKTKHYTAIIGGKRRKVNVQSNN